MCWPTAGAGFGSDSGVPEKRIGSATFGNQPTSGCWMRVTMPLARASGERIASPTLRTSPHGICAAACAVANSAMAAGEDLAEQLEELVALAHPAVAVGEQRVGRQIGAFDHLRHQPMKDLVVAAV